MTEQLKKVSKAACRFIYANYALDEITNCKDTVMYCSEDRMIITITIHEDRFDFLLIFSEKEREEFEMQRDQFTPAICNIYDSHFLHNDKNWIRISVTDMEMLEAVEKLIMIKLKPNRIPFPEECAVYSKCGMRCDLCVHYSGGTINDELRSKLKEMVGSIFGYENYGDDMILCPGCFNKDSNNCGIISCAKGRGHCHCLECNDYPCLDCGILKVDLQANRDTTAEALTYAILPYIGGLFC